jgi:hypothetical protein
LSIILSSLRAKWVELVHDVVEELDHGSRREVELKGAQRNAAQPTTPR